MKYILSIITVIVFSAFAKAQQDSIKIETPLIIVKSKYRETVMQGNVSIKLLDVLEDSRCPSDVNCIWAGQVKLLIEIAENDIKTTKEIIFKNNLRQEIFKSKEINLYLKGVHPIPKSTEKQQVDDYVLLIEKED